MFFGELIMSLENYATLADSIKLFSALYPDKRTVISAINRYLLPAFGFKIAGDRLTNAGKEAAQKLTQSIYLSNLSRDIILEYLNSSFEKGQIPKVEQKFPRSHIKTFIAFLEEKKLIPIISTVKNNSTAVKVEEPTFRFKKNKPIDKKHIELKKKSQHPKIILSLDIQDYILTETNLEGHQITQEIKRINEEIENFKLFLKNSRHCRADSIQIIVSYIRRLLGWIYKSKGLSIKDIHLGLLIGKVQPKINIFNFKTLDSYFIAQGESDLQQKEQSKYLKNLLQGYFTAQKVERNKTKSLFISSIISLAKYFYKDTTDNDEAVDYEDIYLIRAMKAYCRSLPKDTKKIIDLRFTWSEIIEVRNSLKKEADTYFYEISRAKQEGRKQRPKTAIARSIQKFLILCFFTVIPPDRARTIRELEIGKTFKHGLRTSSGFVNVEKLSDRSSAKYYIHLQPEDYKTGDTYGEFWGELPDEVFEDGTTFYQYLNKWIYEGWRDVFAGEAKLQFLFFAPLRHGEQIDPSGMSAVIKNIFLGKTGLPLHPHRLRHIFCSYINELDISQKERDSIAFWMHHSPEMAKATYTHQDMEQKLRAGYELMQKIKSPVNAQCP